MKRHRFDTAVCVHEFPAIMLTAARNMFGFNIRQYFVATDYTCSPGVESLNMDAWFVPIGLSGIFESKGIPKEKIVESGIPISKKYYELPEK